MAYLRQRGNQLAIVRGVRDAATGKVEQQILLTIYSQDEAREAIGPGARWLQALLKSRFPGVPLGWNKIAKAIEEKLGVLPERYEKRTERLLGRFREGLTAFTRQLALADPQSLASAAELIREQEHELAFLRDLIDWRLANRDSKTPALTHDPFFWEHALEAPGIPTDVEELVDGILERGDTDRARGAYELLVEAFGEDADACNSLGWIALEKGELEEARKRFEEAARIGRRAFPRKIAKGRYWSELETRPYVRALRNLALVQNQAGRYDEALLTCDRLEKEVGDDLTAAAHRAAVALNTGRWELAWKSAKYGQQIDPGESFLAAFAAHELGKREEALACFLHGAINNRRAARMLLGQRTSKVSPREARDHNAGVYTLRAIKAYLGSASGKRAVSAIRELAETPAVAELLTEAEAVVGRWRGDNKAPEWRRAFKRMTQMQELAFAKEKAGEIMG